MEIEERLRSENPDRTHAIETQLMLDLEYMVELMFITQTQADQFILMYRCWDKETKAQFLNYIRGQELEILRSLDFNELFDETDRIVTIAKLHDLVVPIVRQEVVQQILAKLSQFE